MLLSLVKSKSIEFRYVKLFGWLSFIFSKSSRQILPELTTTLFFCRLSFLLDHTLPSITSCCSNHFFIRSIFCSCWSLWIHLMSKLFSPTMMIYPLSVIAMSDTGSLICSMYRIVAAQLTTNSRFESVTSIISHEVALISLTFSFCSTSCVRLIVDSRFCLLMLRKCTVRLSHTTRLNSNTSQHSMQSCNSTASSWGVS